MSARSSLRVRSLWGAGLLAIALAACRGVPGRPAGGEIERIVPDETVPLDLFGTFTPSVSRGCSFVSVTSNHQVYVFDRRRRRFLLASASPSGAPATHSSHGGLLPGGGRLSEDGHRVAFVSMADNLLPGAPPLLDQVYVRDLASGELWRGSQSGSGQAAAAAARFARLSGDGRTVVFVSSASNLVEGDTNDAEDVFVHDLVSGGTVRASVGSRGEQADGPSYAPAVSRDGGLVAFASEAPDLVAGDTNRVADVFLRDLATGRTERLSVADGGGQASAPSDAPSLGAKGRFVAFASESDDIVRGDHNGQRDVFLYDRETGRTVLVSAAAGPGGADGPSDNPVVSEDGSKVAFVSSASNLVPGDHNERPDVFLRDLARGRTVRLSVGAGGVEADEESGIFGVAMSPDGSCVAFESYASNLVPEDGDSRVDVFIRRLP